MSIFKTYGSKRARFEDDLKKSYRGPEKYALGRTVKITKKTKAELEGLGKIVREIKLGELGEKDFIEGHYKYFEFFGWVSPPKGDKTEYLQLIEYRHKKDKKDRPLYRRGRKIMEGKLAVVKDPPMEAK